MNFAEKLKKTTHRTKREEDLLAIKKEVTVDEVVDALAKVCADVALKSGDLRLGTIVGLLSPMIVKELFEEELKGVLDD